MYRWRISFSVITLGWPSASASILTPTVSCSWVKLYSWLSTTWALASRLSSTTMRMPSRSDSSRRSLICSIFLSFTRPAMLSISRALFTI